MVYNGVNTVIPIPKSFYKPKVRSGYQREFITLQNLNQSKLSHRSWIPFGK
ncbi:hypothetical protein YC2023_073235 [Brassica napus]